MTAHPASSLTQAHRDFFERFKSFWAAPTGARVAELIAPDATIHFSGAGVFSGLDYRAVMQQMLDAMPDLVVTPLDWAADGERMYIAWETQATIHGERRTYRGVDRFRIKDGMAVEEHVIFDTAVLQPEGVI
jgi:SnoaL-like domain